jgi:hypothetical protein
MTTVLTAAATMSDRQRQVDGSMTGLDDRLTCIVVLLQ